MKYNILLLFARRVVTEATVTSFYFLKMMLTRFPFALLFAFAAKNVFPMPTDSNPIYVRQLVYSIGGLYIQDRDVNFCVNVQFSEARFPSLPPVQSAALQTLLQNSCTEDLSPKGTTLVCCKKMRTDGPLPVSTSFAIGSLFENAVPGLLASKFRDAPVKLRHNVDNEDLWFESEFIFDIETYQ
jgi:hypothetical protein